ncbi:hypothetical protein PHYBOEH_005289 [Phytophthora boehmeriae]|uniref:Uncharacterized protein n=1 Tax=Phytophthora boehmeriae TaxID=109152 RepID=A0A8T1WR98_9STRA|nr:hypothetical protein PHYBOEH_005289 [Phytophthora boehmeriae]
MAPLRTLRPVLFLVAFFFVLVPLLAYNFFTFDFQRVAAFEHRFRAGATNSSLVSELPKCLDIPSLDFIQNASEIIQHCQVTQNVVYPTNRQRLVHFVNVALDAVPLWDGEEDSGREQFSYLQFAALQSIRKFLQPEMMIMHYFETPRGVWFTQCQRHLSLHQVLPPVTFDAMKNAGPPYLNRHQRRQLIEFLVMLRTLKRQGGVAFSDFNTFLLRAPGIDMQSDMVVASQSRAMGSHSGEVGGSTRSAKTFSIGVHTMQAPPGHPFVEYLEQRLIAMVDTNDPKLHQMPLEKIVGQLTLKKYLEEHGDVLDGGSTANGTASNSTTAHRSSIMDGVIIGTSNLFEHDGLHEFLTTKAGPSFAGRLRGVTGFHIDRFDFAEQTADTDDLREIGRMQKELTTTDEWLSLDTVVGAVMRLALSANTSAELDPLVG